MDTITALVDTNFQAAAPITAFNQPLQLAPQPQVEETNLFSSAFDAALSVLNDTNNMQLQANQMQLDFATGRLDDILAVQMAMGRAADSLSFTAQITNRIIESYREIMRMQI